MDQKVNKELFGLFEAQKFDSFKREFQSFLRRKNYKNDNDELKFNNDECICNLKKVFKPNWTRTVKYPINGNEPKNSTKYRVCIIKIWPGLYYIERNGGIGLPNVLKAFNFTRFDSMLWNDTNEESFNGKLKSYMIREPISQINKLIKNNEDIIEIDFPTSTNDLESIYRSIEYVPDDQKLPSFDYAATVQQTSKGEKSSETKYNELICTNNENYILLDQKLDEKHLEIADIYDKKHKLFFHNKKGNDLRVLASQIILGAMRLKNQNSRKNFLDRLATGGIDVKQLNGGFEHIKYVAGIIGSVGGYKDEVILGLVSFHLRKMGIGFYINIIPIINSKQGCEYRFRKGKNKGKSCNKVVVKGNLCKEHCNK